MLPRKIVHSVLFLSCIWLLVKFGNHCHGLSDMIIAYVGAGIELGMLLMYWAFQINVQYFVSYINLLICNFLMLTQDYHNFTIRSSYD